MTFMARGEYLLDGQVHVPPSGAPSPEPLHRPFAACAVLRTGGNQVRNPPAVPGYGDGLSMLYRPKELGQVFFGFGGSNLTHKLLRPVVITILVY